ncbi:methyltransferase, FxLD system [Streptomyces laurentii]|uniref:methyltransferase, FxLD system n=1 Tax=Streptomyces laurentii TaxID=39478 RepID=UPI0033D83B4A
MSPDRWHQHNITFVDRGSARQIIATAIGPELVTAQAAGEISGWWYLNKQPWPLRYRTDGLPAPSIGTLLDGLVAEARIVRWTPGIYEPEAVAFGGEAAMEAAHTLFHHDSRHLLACPTTSGHLGRRETAVLLISAMMRAAGLDWYEQGDVWAKAAALRPPAVLPSPERTRALRRSMLRLMTADADCLCRTGGPLAERKGWLAAFVQAGAELAHLARGGQLERGLRAVIAHHVIFHCNRAGLLLEDQSTLSSLAKEVVMGTSDSTASPVEPGTPSTNFTRVNTDTFEETGAHAEHLRNRLIDQIAGEGHVHTRSIEHALRTVPRHLFVPGVSLEAAYADTTVSIKRDSDGTSISCASQPSVVALMLEQLQPQPGQRILELGAGTGYNAALLASLVGDRGHVTTIDVDNDLVDGARRNLMAAEVDNVTTMLGDGAVGYVEGAPYDRIIATVGAHGIPPAWTDQLAPGGRLLVPQRLKGSVSRSIAYEHASDGRWVSVSSKMNTFMPLRRGIADDDRRRIPLTADGSVRLQAHAEQHVDADALTGMLDQPRAVVWSGVMYRAMESPEWMELWLTCVLPSGLSLMLFPQNAKGTVLTEDPYPSSTAAFAEGALIYLTRRLSDQKTPDGGKLWEFGVAGHGPGHETLVEQAIDAMRTWDHDYRDRVAAFEIQALDATPPTTVPGTFALYTPLGRILVTWQ